MTGSPPGAHPTGPTDALLLRAYDGRELSDHAAAEIAAGEVPGVTLYRHHNVASAAQVRGLTAAMQAARPAGTPPLLIAIDQEGGQLLGLGADSTPFAGNHALGAVDDPDLAERVGAAIGRECAACGVNVLFAPVCDLLTEPTSPGFGIRTFGDDPDRAGLLAAAFVRGVQSVGVAATLKHFPGAGGVAVDTHHDLAAVDADRDLLDRRELAVFRTALAASPGLVMSGHFAVPGVTGRSDLPATLTGEVMRDLLRNELGFDGVTVTDALDMHALAQGDGQVLDALAALQAGVDLLLCGLDEPANARLRDGLRHAWQRRLLDPDAVAASSVRVDRLRQRLGTVAQPDLGVVGGVDHRALADELARRAITLVRDDAGRLPLTAAADRTILVVEPRPRDLTPADTTSFVPPLLAETLASRLPGVRGIVVDDAAERATVTAAVDAARDADLVVLGTAAAHLDPAQAELARAVVAVGTPVVGVALRTVGDLAVLADVPTVLCTYGVHRPQIEALVDVLCGETDATGRLPVAAPA